MTGTVIYSGFLVYHIKYSCLKPRTPICANALFRVLTLGGFRLRIRIECGDYGGNCSKIRDLVCKGIGERHVESERIKKPMCAPKRGCRLLILSILDIRSSAFSISQPYEVYACMTKNDSASALFSLSVQCGGLPWCSISWISWRLALSSRGGPGKQMKNIHPGATRARFPPAIYLYYTMHGLFSRKLRGGILNVRQINH